MNKIKIAIAIPTFNRLNKLRFCLSNIEEQVIDDRFEVYCVISDQESTDGTTEFLNNLNSTKIKYVINTKRVVSTNFSSNNRRVANLIPQEIDWVWFHGDDDYLTSQTVLKELVDFIQLSGDVTLICACEERRSRRSNTQLKASLFDLCNSLGYHEILGWMSSLIVKKDEFVTAINLSTEIFNELTSWDDCLKFRYSAYAHSIALLEVCCHKNAAFIDSAWIATQDSKQSDETLVRWQKEHTGIRYLFVMNDLLKLQKKGIFTKKLSLIFFRYNNYSLWDRFANYLTAEVVENGVLSDIGMEMLDDLRDITNLIESPQSKKIFLQWYQGFSHQILEYSQLTKKLQGLNKNLRITYDLNNSSSYPAQILGESGEIISNY
jgi:glycosyltransferase involved in cell wall biosynthesis